MDTVAESFLSINDYAVIGFCFVFTIVIGITFRTFANDTGVSFRGREILDWSKVGSSVSMGPFSAWVFTGADSKETRRARSLV